MQRKWKIYTLKKIILSLETAEIRKVFSLKAI